MNKYYASGIAAVLTLSFSLPAFAAETLNVRCIQSAIEKREASILSTLDTYNVTVKNALIVRKDDLKVAWEITNKDERRDAIKAARSAMETASKDAQKVKKAANKTAAGVFRKTMKHTCKQSDTDSASESADGQL